MTELSQRPVKPGRPELCLPPGPGADLITAVKEVIAAAHSEGPGGTGRKQLAEYTKRGGPGSIAESTMSRNLGGERPDRGPGWEFILRVVDACVPADHHRQRRRLIETGDLHGASDKLAGGTPHPEKTAALEQLAGMWWAAWRYPPDYEGNIIYPDGFAPPRFAVAAPTATPDEKLAIIRCNYAVQRGELRGLRDQIRESTTARLRLSAVLQQARVLAQERTERRDDALAEVAELEEEIAERDSQLRHLEDLVSQQQVAADGLTRQIEQLTSLLTDRVHTLHTAEAENARLRSEIVQLQSEQRASHVLITELNDTIRDRERRIAVLEGDDISPHWGGAAQSRSATTTLVPTQPSTRTAVKPIGTETEQRRFRFYVNPRNATLDESEIRGHSNQATSEAKLTPERVESMDPRVAARRIERLDEGARTALLESLGSDSQRRIKNNLGDRRRT